MKTIRYGMFEKFDPERDISFLELPHLHQVSFCASLCERTIPNFKLHDECYGGNEFQFLRETLDEVWSSLLDRRSDPDKVQVLINGCSALLEEYGEALDITSLPGSALSCLELTLTLFAQPFTPSVIRTIEHVHNALYYYFETSLDCISSYWSDEEVENSGSIFTIDDILPFREINELFSRNDGEHDRYKDFYKQLNISLLNHPNTRKEIKKENEDLCRLKKTSVLSPELISWLRKTSENGGKSFLGI